MHLHSLRERNMAAGNTWLTSRITRMLDAADSDEMDSTPSSPNVNGKGVVISLNEYVHGTSV